MLAETCVVAVMTRRPLIIDTDPGIDDAIALLVAAASSEIELIGVTTVFGNVDLEQTTDNALRILALASAAQVPVAAGAHRPLVHAQPHRQGHVHGSNGLGDVRLPPAQRAAEPTPAVRFLADLLRTADAPITICALGPLTNIALLVASDPVAAARIERLVVMGGAYGSGNVAPTAEFNVRSDPEAAHRVLTSGLPITMVGLDVTRPTAMDAAAVARIRASGSVGARAAEMLAHYLDYYIRVQGAPGVVIHDALAVQEAITPGLLGTVERQVSVDCGQGPARGRTLVGRRTVPGSAAAPHSVPSAAPVRVSEPVQSATPVRIAESVQSATLVRIAESVDVPRALAEIETRLRSYGP